MPSNPQFQVGDIVRFSFKSISGPKMVVIGNGSDGKVICQWFTTTTFHEAAFLPQMLKNAENEGLGVA